MKVQIPARPRGIALIIVMVVMVSLGILAGGFAYSMKVETTLARNANNDAELEWMGRSGIELAKYILSQPRQGGVDALNQKWAGGTGDTNSPAAEIPMDSFSIGRGTISLKIVDHERKFNINTAPRNSEILRQALILVGIDAAEGTKIFNAILDWIDPDDNPQMGSSDTESSYYMQLKPPYRAKNGLIDDLSEMMLINGITPAMFYGSGQVGQLTRGTVHRQGQSRSTLDEPTYPVGFAELFTTISSGRVNVNTASATVLQMFINDTPNAEQAAQNIITARAGLDGVEGNEDDTPFHSVAEVMGAMMGMRPGMPPGAGGQPGMPPGAAGQPGMPPGAGNYFTFISSTFDVEVLADIGGQKRHFVGVLQRDGNKLQNLFFYWD
jgi:type II secretory pathway component PulK